MTGPLLPFKRTGREGTRATFEAFHARHPEVFQLFRQFSRELREHGWVKYSARTIVERIRWHFDINRGKDGGLKINDHLSPHYARLLIETDPTFTEFFELRERRSA